MGLSAGDCGVVHDSKSPVTHPSAMRRILFDPITSPPSNGASKDLHVLHLTLHEARLRPRSAVRSPFPGKALHGGLARFSQRQECGTPGPVWRSPQNAQAGGIGKSCGSPTPYAHSVRPTLHVEYRGLRGNTPC